MADEYVEPPGGAVISRDEAVRIYREGRDAHAEGLQFHESKYPGPGDASCSNDDYERGFHWRRGWNDSALAERDVKLVG